MRDQPPVRAGNRRSSLQAYEATLRKRVLARLAKFDDPLIPALVYWITYDELGAACEAVGMIKSSTVTEFITPHQMAKEMLATMRAELP
jgi:hypothetical protein